MVAILYKGYLSGYLYLQSLIWSSNFRLGKKQHKKEQKNKTRKRRKKNFRDCGVLRIVSQSFAGSVAGLTKPPRFVWSTMDGVHRIPVFLDEYWKAERIDRKEGKRRFFLLLGVHSYSGLYIGSMWKSDISLLVTYFTTYVYRSLIQDQGQLHTYSTAT